MPRRERWYAQCHDGGRRWVPKAGERLIWVIDPARRTVRVFRADGTGTLLSARDVIDGEDVLPGFRLPVVRLLV